MVREAEREGMERRWRNCIDLAFGMCIIGRKCTIWIRPSPEERRMHIYTA